MLGPVYRQIDLIRDIRLEAYWSDVGYAGTAIVHPCNSYALLVSSLVLFKPLVGLFVC